MLHREDFLEDMFDVEATLSSEIELQDGYIYLGWVINPMTAERFKVFGPEDYKNSSKRREYILCD